jgi:hypothetical protein
VLTLRDLQLRAVAFPEGDIWVVQGVEYDVVAQANDLTDAPGAFLRQFVSTLMAYQHLGEGGVDMIPPAPDRFREMFETAVSSAEVRLTSVAREGPMPSTEIELRAYAQAA